jgi:hypothetical protein
VRSASADPGTIQGAGLPTPGRARRREGEIQRPDYARRRHSDAVADPGSIPGVSIGIREAAQLSGFLHSGPVSFPSRPARSSALRPRRSSSRRARRRHRRGEDLFEPAHMGRIAARLMGLSGGIAVIDHMRRVTARRQMPPHPLTTRSRSESPTTTSSTRAGCRSSRRPMERRRPSSC